MRRVAFVFFIAVLFLALGYWAWKRHGQTGEPLAAATVLSEARATPTFTLTDQDQQPFTREQLHGRWSLLFFGYTHCPDVCPGTLTLMHAVRSQLAGDKSLPPLHVVFVSVDPQRDSPQQLKPYVRTFDTSFTGVTGPLPQLETLTNALYVPFSHTARSSGGYDVDHSGALVLINPDAGAVAYFSPPHRLQDVVHDLDAIMRGSPLASQTMAQEPPSAAPQAHHHHE